MSFHTVSHDTQLQGRGSNGSSGSGKGLSYVCICMSSQVRKGIFMWKVSPDGRKDANARQGHGREGVFSLTYSFSSSKRKPISGFLDRI